MRFGRSGPAGTTGRGVAHGKAILLGEHAVVYGQPALVIPLVRLRVAAAVDAPGIAVPNDRWRHAADGVTWWVDSSVYRGPLDRTPEALRGLQSCIQAWLSDHRQRGAAAGPHVITIRANLPIGRGLGSSAAAAVAVLRALASWAGDEAADEALRPYVDQAEAATHGRASGVDAAAVLAATPLWYTSGQPARMDAGPRTFHFVLADTGVPGQTRAAVAQVRIRMQAQPAATRVRVRRLGRLAEDAKEAWLAGDDLAVGAAMDEAQAALADLGVSHPALDGLVRAARAEGALGSKLTGSGCGGCTISLAQSAEHAASLSRALLASGATQTWCVEIPGHTAGTDQSLRKGWGTGGSDSACAQ
ncbi:MAG: mevalonate kinase [Alicyclobacillus sp.]|nr:mevalonate kinase [Alicyclobacillus sp.]